ncbi:MAG: hypothetical protein NZ742_10670 [Acidobacteria bacterium]|nr:hypothetical protein [Acidobacteriota bacterium]MDW7985182.1 hypothetical protein [Acidobacteriota bacterium]
MGLSRAMKARRLRKAGIQFRRDVGPTCKPAAGAVLPETRPTFRGVDLSQAVPSYAVRVTLRYQVVRPREARRARVWLAEGPDGQGAVCLTDDAGVVCLRLQVPSRVYAALEDPRLHLNLWVVECVALRRSEC